MTGQGPADSPGANWRDMTAFLFSTGCIKFSMGCPEAVRLRQLYEARFDAGHIFRQLAKCLVGMRFLFKRSCGERLSKETLLKVDWRHTSKTVTGAALNRFTLALKHRNTGSIDRPQTAPPRLQFSQPRRNFRADFVSCKGAGCALKLLGTPVFGPGLFLLFGQRIPLAGRFRGSPNCCRSSRSCSTIRSSLSRLC
jgi:hypothetical protein